MADFDRTRTQFLIDALNPARRTRVVDVGANPINDCPYKPLLDMGGCEVFGFEPQPEAFAAVQAKAGPNETYLPYAIGDGQAHTLYMTQNSGFASLLEPDPKANAFLGKFWRGVKVMEEVAIETKRIDDIAELPEFDLLKIDIQGGEQMVFDNARTKLAGAVCVISEVAAVPLYKDQPLLDAQMATLRAQGFHLHRFMFFKQVRLNNRLSTRTETRGNRSQLLDGDAVFVRGMMEFDQMPDEQLKHLIILADAVFGSHDLAMEAMIHLIDRGIVDETVGDTYVGFINGDFPAQEAAQ